MKGFVIFISIMMLVPLASAGEWRGDGTPLYVIAEGSIHGGVYVGGGHGLTYEDPYVEYFNLPSNIEYARLYVPMWNYDESDWVEVSINGKSLGRRSKPDYVAAWGVASYAYTITNKVSSGMNKVSVTYHNTNGAPYSIVLVAVYKDAAMPQTRFWIAEGNQALSYIGKIDNAKVTFEGDIPYGTRNATLWTMMIGGNEGEIDRLYFNSNLLGEDVGRGKSGAYFDLDRWNVTEFVNTSNNTARFERGGESYIHPFNAIFSIESMKDQGKDYIQINSIAEAKYSGVNIPKSVVLVMVLSILFLVYMVRRNK